MYLAERFRPVKSAYVAEHHRPVEPVYLAEPCRPVEPVYLSQLRFVLDSCLRELGNWKILAVSPDMRWVRRGHDVVDNKKKTGQF